MKIRTKVIINHERYPGALAEVITVPPNPKSTHYVVRMIANGRAILLSSEFFTQVEEPDDQPRDS